MLYDFKCSVCGAVELDKILHISHTDDQHPECCYGKKMAHYHTKAPYVSWEDRQLLNGGFRANHDGTVITTHKQNNEYMKRHGLHNAMDDGAPPTHQDDIASNRKSQQAIDAITPTDAQMNQMKSDGTLEQIEKMME